MLPSITVSPPNSSASRIAPWRLMPPSAMSGTRCRRPPAAFDERLQLRHAEAGGEPRRAAAARADADLDGVDAALGEKPHAVGGRDVAGDELDVAEMLA